MPLSKEERRLKQIECVKKYNETNKEAISEKKKQYYQLKKDEIKAKSLARYYQKKQQEQIITPVETDDETIAAEVIDDFETPEFDSEF